MSTLTLRILKNKPPCVIKIKKFSYKLFVCGLLAMVTISVPAQSISNLVISEENVCAGGNITISFNLTDGSQTDEYFTGETLFQAFLTDNSGSVFTEIGAPFQVPLHNSLVYDPENHVQQQLTIPSETMGGTYKLALVSASPAFDGRISGVLSTSFTVNKPVSVNSGPNTNEQSVCEDGSVSLSVDAVGTDIAIQWYKNNSKSNQEGAAIAGANASTYFPETAKAEIGYYYAVISNSCSQITTDVSGAVIVKTTPLVSVEQEGAGCGSGQVFLKAIASAGTVNWYDQPSGGAALASGTNYSPNISSTTTYYVDATENGCTSTSRTAITGVVKTVPSITSTTNDEICGSGVVSLKATASSGIINWYSSASGGSALASGTNYSPNISSTTTYYVDATENGCTSPSRTAILGVVKTVPSITSTTSDEICGSGVVSLKAIASSGTINWYSSASGGSALASGTNYSPSISSTTAYYIDATENGCTSTSRTAITGVVKTVPSITSTTSDEICGSGVVSLKATASSGIINWYSSASGGSALASGTNYSPSISSTTAYYIDATENGCTSPSRTAILAGVKTVPSVTSTTSDEICGSGVVSLKATASSGAINWYSSASGGSALASGTNYSPNISSTTTYFIDATEDGCTSTSRTAITGVVKTVPSITSTTNDEICGSGVVSLKATASSGTINWYSSASGGSALASGTNYSPNISSTTTYYINATENGCTSTSRTAITGVVKTVPSITSTTSDEICGSGVVSLKATASSGAINWYSSASGGSALASGTNYSPNISSTTTYYIDATENGCISPSRTAILAGVKTVPSITSATSDEICGSGVVSLKATASSGIINWYSSASGGSALASGTNYSPNISSTTTYYIDATENGCTTAGRKTITGTVDPFPSAPASISAPESVCPFTPGIKISISAVSNADFYKWTLPPGWNITSGVGTTSITATSGPSGTGIITVSGINDCGEGISKIFSVMVKSGAPAVPGMISGTVAQCPGLSNQTYSVAAVGNVDTYTWTVPSGWSILSGNGTASVRVMTGSAGKNGTISVSAENSCGVSLERSLPVTVQPGVPVNPSNLSGFDLVCPLQTGLKYTINPVAAAAFYDWKVPDGWIINANNGTSITVTSGTSGKNGVISVSAVNSCGRSTETTIAVSVSAGKPATPGTITAGSVCSQATAVYSVAEVPSAESYYWSFPSGWSIVSGQNTSSATVVVGAFGQNGNVAVTASNSCGASNPKYLTITVKNTPTVAATPATQSLCTGNAISAISLTNPNAVSGTIFSWQRSNTGSSGVTALVSTGTSASINGTVVNSSSTIQTTDFSIIASSNGCSSSTNAQVVVYPNIFNNELTTPTKQYNCDKNIQVIINQANVPLSGGDGSYTFEWQISDNGNNKWETLPGETGISLNILQTDQNTFYRRIVRSGNCAISYSDEVHVNLSAIKVEDPAIVTGGGSYCSGGTGVAIGIDGSTTGALYQLYLGSNKVGLPIAGTGMPLNFGLFTTAGTYTVTGYTVNPDASVCSRSMQGSVKVVVDTKATVSNAGQNKSFCNITTSSLSANVPISGSGKWSLLGGSATIITPTSPTSVISNLKEGDQVFKWTITNGTCFSESQVTIHVDKPVTVPDAGDSQKLCNTSATTLAGNAALSGSGSWTKLSGSGVIKDAGNPASEVTGLLPGDSKFAWAIKGSGSCPDPAASQVVIHVDAPATVANAGPQRSICISNPSVTLQGNVALIGGGNWAKISGSGSVTSPNSPASTVTSLSQGGNVFRWTITNGTCSSYDDVTIQVDAVPSSSNAGGNKQVCDNITSLTLAALNPSSGTGTWSLRSGTANISDINKYNTSVTGLTPGDNVFRWTVSNGVCTPSSSDVIISVNTPPSVSVEPSEAIYICEGTSGAAITVSGAGTGISYIWQVSTNGGSTYNYVSGSAYSGYNSAKLTINQPTMAMNGNLYRVIINAQSGCASYVYSSPAKIVHRSVWTGVYNSDWNTAGNWSDKQVPGTGCPTVTIPDVSPNVFPVLTGGSKASIVNLLIQPNASVTVSGNTLQLAGNISNKGTFNAINGSIELNGSIPQVISSSTFKDNAVGNFIISNTNASGVTLGGQVDIYRSLTFGIVGGKLNTANLLTLKSSATETAWVGDMTGHTIIGDVTVERYVNSAKNGKKWLFLASPVKGQTVKESWMEGGAKSNTASGNGVQITGPQGTAAGFDLQSAAPSMKTWNEITGLWEGIPNTNVQLYNTKGYMIFVRGDRSITDPRAASNATTLRSRGALIIGNLSIPIQSPVDKFISVGNPYASAIDMVQLAKNSDLKFFTVWNPRLGGQYGYGAYETYYLSNNTFKSIPWNKEYKNIESGQAFFVQTSSKAGASINFSESVKSANSVSSYFRAQGGVDKTSSMQTTLSSLAASGDKTLLDGTLQEFSDDFTNSLDDLDGRKITNSGENIALKAEGKSLVVERRELLSEKDTIQYYLSGLSAKNYVLGINSVNFSDDNLQPYLEDIYLNKKIPLNLSGATEVSFSVTNVAASASAKRFRIIFAKTMAPLPVTITSVKATQKEKYIEIEWNVENEINLEKYEVQRSANGNTFSTIAIVAAANNTRHTYNYIDKDVHGSGYFYRIRSVDLNGKSSVSKIVYVKLAPGISTIAVYPNPVTNGKLNVQFMDQQQGNYKIRLLNTAGQVILSQSIEHSGGSALKPVNLQAMPAAGVYQLEVSCPDGKIKVLRVIF